MTLTRHHSLISSFVSCPVYFPCSFAPCYEVLMTPEPFEEFRYSGCGTSLHGAAANCLVSVVPLSFDLELQLCHVSGAVGVISLGTAVGYTQNLVRDKPCGIVWTLQEPENSTILPVPRSVLNDDEGGLCLWPPGV